MTPAIDVRDAFRIYESQAGGTAALQGLTLAVERGEIVVVLGPSGSGKTTLLRVVAGLEQLSAGGATVLGTALGGLDAGAAAAFRAANVGLLDQHYARALSPDLSCRQTVGLQLELLGGDPGASRRAADALLAGVGLAGRAGERPSALSGGEQQRVAVCAAVAHRPRLLLADEPAGELDSASAAVVYRLLAELVRGSGATALIVSHDKAAAAIADRLVHIRDGRVVEQSRPGEAPALVVSHGGWVRLPDPLLQQLERPGLVSVAGGADRIVLFPADRQPRSRGEEAAAPLPAARALVAEVRGVQKAYPAPGGERVVFGDLNCAFRGGVFSAVVGRSGSGKTTLLHLIAGLERPTGGDVILLGLALDGRPRSELADLRRREIALVTQEPGLVPYLSALENVQLGLDLRGSTGDTDARAQKALLDVGLDGRLAVPASRLSAGERERVAIARALAADARLLLVDEPTARLDEESARGAAKLLARAAHERGLAVVCATHDPAVIELADEVVSLDAVPPASAASGAGSGAGDRRRLIGG